MINHISIGVHDPEKVAGVIGELWNGYVLPFPAAPNSFVVLAGDGRGTAVEITTINTVLVPGAELPADREVDAAEAEEYEAKWVAGDTAPQRVATHLAINTHLSEDEVLAIARREGWRALTCSRGGGLFQLIEVWAENRFLLEVFTPEMTARYIEIINPQSLSELMGITLPPRRQRADSLNLIG